MQMTPGPTTVPERVREAMARPPQNPDVDPAFVEFYHDLEAKLAAVYRTDDDVLVLGGEGILGLEAAVASTVGPGDEVLCVSNGVYGDGFAEFVAGVGAEPVLCTTDYHEPLDVERAKALVESHDFAAATMVHCETPTGSLTDLDELLAVLDDAGVLSIVDAVSSLGGTPVPTERIDLCLGASQKCFSSPPGLTTISVSDDAWDAVEARQPQSYYTSLLPWKEQWLAEEWFPYTHLVSNLYGLDESLSMLLEEGLAAVHERHREAAARCRELGRDLGLSVFPADESRSSPTVTAFSVPGRAEALQAALREEHDVLVATGLGDLAEDVLRIGHMGVDADVEKVERTMAALGDVL